jgi:glycosyltransferase involved in cell wall biosynthesis
MDEIVVSIVCNTYNHEPFIADAIESFLMQKTSFKYEVLINDDASTDKTAEIIKKYEKKYPKIIKPVYQAENQLSKGIKIGRINEDRSVGKYIALCEGDDFWTDPNKLQKQTEFMENNTQYSLCVHAATQIDALTNKRLNDIRPSRFSKEFSTEEIIFGGGGIFPTNSMFYRRKESKIKPDFYNNSPVGDYPLAIFLSLIGKVYYIDEFMSTYRYGVPGSWTEREYSTVEKRIVHYKMIEDMLRELNTYTDNAYLDVIEKTILRNKIKEC